jgi:hypothetical protein
MAKAQGGPVDGKVLGNRGDELSHWMGLETL